MYFPRMLDKIRMHARGELTEDYHANLGSVSEQMALARISCEWITTSYASASSRAGVTRRFSIGVMTTDAGLTQEICWSGTIFSQSWAGTIS